MKRLFVFIAFIMAVQIFACDAGWFVIKAKAVLADRSSKTGYFLMDGHLYSAIEGKVFGNKDINTIRNGTNVLPYISTGDWMYTDNYIQLPCGYYYNEDRLASFHFTDVDSLIYMSEYEPDEVNGLVYWNPISTRKSELAKQGIFNYYNGQAPTSTFTYTSLTDSVSMAELEIYSMSIMGNGDSNELSKETSFFCNTKGNKLVIDSLKYNFNNNDNTSLIAIRSMFETNRTRLEQLIPIINRNVLMNNEDKLKYVNEIREAIHNIDIFIRYYTQRIEQSSLVDTTYSFICNMYPDDKTPLSNSDTRFWNSFTKALFPQLSNYYESDLWGDELDNALIKVGLLLL